MLKAVCDLKRCGGSFGLLLVFMALLSICVKLFICLAYVHGLKQYGSSLLAALVYSFSFEMCKAVRFA